MGSSGSGVVDSSVGTIVWVRRRNGSWWPGKILGPDELSASHLMSPRSGTPVKLLGREDASVDWYNLEKSKRVKAFRCGEFDDCIERAESSQGIPIKKREKYARREDAILHALELEKQQLAKKQGKLGIASDCTSSKSCNAVKKELVTSSESLGNENGKLGISKSQQLSKRLDSTNKDDIMGNPLYSQKAKEGSQINWEDDTLDVIPRMRGLQDFGLRTAPSKRKLSSAVSNGSRKQAVDNAQAIPSSSVGMGSITHASSKSSIDKRKRLYEGLTEESLVKRRDRRRPLVQVLQNTEKLPVPHLLQTESGTVSSIAEAEQMGSVFRAKRSRCVYLPSESDDRLEYKEIPPSEMELSPSQFGDSNNHPHPSSLTEENTSEFMEGSESDSSETEADTDAEMTELAETVAPAEAEAEAKALGKPVVPGEDGSMSSEEPDESALTGDLSHLHPHDPVSASVGVSKWQLKGKRNMRNLTKRSAEVVDGKVSNGSIHKPYLEENGNTMGQRTLGQSMMFHHSSNDFDNDLHEADLIEKDFGTQMAGLDGRGYSLTSKTAPRARNMIDWEELTWEDQPALKGYWEDTGECFDPIFVGRHNPAGRIKTTLVDVDLRVQTNYQREHVPIISLMSRLNDKSIVGHPIQIEALEDGSSEMLLSSNEDFGNDVFDNDRNRAIPPVWRTARRTANFRVPRPHPSSALDGDEAVEDLPFLDQGRKSTYKKSNAGNSGHKGSIMRKSLPHIPRPPTDRKFPRKMPKMVSLSSSQKTRTLSSIAIEQKHGNRPKHDSHSYKMDGLIKQESSGPTAVACIPIKLVFSRLNESVCRPPSRATSNVVSVNGDPEKNPS
ncbi:hypothetical protein VitviT2T_024166 [Vitis vinifera]|uniref:PWWP domain-containing protein n=2 Tax=Vitis vinifera TaxID=29760 RepID=A0ABY9DGX5_VITVI|nr:uncharacterized protein At1g51745 isoform X1 [Vitis vinifera]WKA06257.1 hypothetical protein VitviT2T_024166 [Vitis vinifera]|eukprot:XP_002274927.1 PREDICTED: uncharacterized protein At1g51745 isoform X1 [Vitis vinifera]